DTTGRRAATVEVQSFGPAHDQLEPDGRRFALTLPDDAPPAAEGDMFVAQVRRLPPQARLFPGAPDFAQTAEARGLSGRLWLQSPLYPVSAASPSWGALDRHRQRAHDLLTRHSPGGVLPALALGQGRAVQPEVRALYGRCGLAHVLAVSGLHFGLVAVAIFGLATRLTRRVPWVVRRFSARRAAVCVALPILALYVVYVGAPVSARRAFVMAACLMSGHLLERRGHPIVSLSAAAVLLLLSQPAELFSAGFQLSFAAVAGLLWTAENYEKPLRARFSH